MRDQIFQDVNDMLKKGEKKKVAVLRMLKSAILEKERELKKTLSDEEVIEVITKQIKTRNESIEQFKQGERSDLMVQTQMEIDCLSQYLPKQLTSAELDKIIEDVFKEVKPSGMRDMGKVMKTIMPKIKGRANMGIVNQKIKEKLGG